MIDFNCPQCKSAFSVPDNSRAAGALQKCQTPITVPAVFNGEHQQLLVEPPAGRTAAPASAIESDAEQMRTAFEKFP